MNDLSLDEISERIVDAVLNETYLNKDNLKTLVRPILKIWLKQTDGFKSHNVPVSKLQLTIQSRQIQHLFWRKIVRELVNEDQIKKYYLELDELLIKEGFVKK